MAEKFTFFAKSDIYSSPHQDGMWHKAFLKRELDAGPKHTSL